MQKYPVELKSPSHKHVIYSGLNSRIDYIELVKMRTTLTPLLADPAGLISAEESTARKAELAYVESRIAQYAGMNTDLPMVFTMWKAQFYGQTLIQLLAWLEYTHELPRGVSSYAVWGDVLAEHIYFGSDAMVLATGHTQTIMMRAMFGHNYMTEVSVPGRILIACAYLVWAFFFLRTCCWVFAGFMTLVIILSGGTFIGLLTGDFDSLYHFTMLMFFYRIARLVSGPMMTGTFGWLYINAWSEAHCVTLKEIAESTIRDTALDREQQKNHKWDPVLVAHQEVMLKAAHRFLQRLDEVEMDNKHFPGIIEHTMSLYTTHIERHKKMVEDGHMEPKNI
jgi:hypothetical protein